MVGADKGGVHGFGETGPPCANPEGPGDPLEY